MIEEDEVNILILSDRGVNRDFAPVPALLAVAGLHHYLIREGLRTRVSLVLETGEAREVHHFSLLIGYGCSAINPYLAFETLDDMIREGLLPNVDHKTACKNFVKAATKGVIKVMSKMGISAIQSYRGAQVFEARRPAPGRDRPVLHLDLVAHRRHRPGRHRAGGPDAPPCGVSRPAGRTATRCPPGGQYQWRNDGEQHLFNPESIHRLQKAVRTGSFETLQVYARLHRRPGDQRSARCAACSTSRPATPIPIEEVEPVESIVKRFKTGAMSYGSISKEAHETLAIAMNRIGGKSNTGEGGEDPERYVLLPNGDSQEFRDQAGGLGPLRRDERVPGQRARAADQDGAGREARRGRPAARHQGLSVDREDPAHHRRRRPDLPAAAPRHLLHRGSGRADPRPEERQPRRAHQREAGGRGRRRHDRRGRRQGACGRGADQRLRRRHGRLAADLDHARRPALGARPRRDAPDAGAQQPAQPHRGRDRRPAEDRPRRRHRGAAGRRGVRLRHRAAGRGRLHHDARVPPEHLPGRRRDAGSASCARSSPASPSMWSTSCASSPRRCARSWRSSASAPSRRWSAASTAWSRARPSTTGRRRASISATSSTSRTSDRRSAASARSRRTTAWTSRSTSRRCSTSASRRSSAARRSRRSCPSATSTASSARSPAARSRKKWGAKGLPEDTIRILFKGSAGQSFGAFMPQGMTFLARGRRQRLRRQGPLGRQDHRLSLRPAATFVPEDNIIIGNVALYGATSGEVVHPRHGGRALLRAQQRRQRRCRGAWATTAAST